MFTVTSLPVAQLQQILGCLEPCDVSAARAVCSQRSTLRAAWLELHLSGVHTDDEEARARKTLDMCIGSLLRHVGIDNIGVDLLRHLAAVAPRLGSLGTQMLEDELEQAESSFLAFEKLDRLEVWCQDWTTTLALPSSLRQLVVEAVSPGMLQGIATLECLEVYGAMNQVSEPAIVLQLCASAPCLRSVILPFLFGVGVDFGPLTNRLLRHDLDSIRIRKLRQDVASGFVSAFPLQEADRLSCLDILSVVTSAAIEMTSNVDCRLCTWFSDVQMRAPEPRDLQLLSRQPRPMDSLLIDKSTQSTVNECPKLQVPDVWLEARPGAAVSVTVPRMDGTGIRKLRLSGFAEVRFEYDFVPGYLEQIWLDGPPSNTPIDAVSVVVKTNTVLLFPL